MSKKIRLLAYYFLCHLKSMLIYRIDFLFTVVTDVLWSVAGLMIILGVFGATDKFGSFSHDEAIFMYGFSLTSLGIYYIFFSNVTNLPDRYVFQGELDRIITRPISTYFQLLLDKFSINKSGDTIMGITLITIFGGKIKENWLLLDVTWMIILCISASFIYLGINAISSFACFWIADKYGLSETFSSFRLFSKYPLDIYNNILKSILTYVIPFAFTSYYPALCFIEDRYELGLLTILVAIVITIIKLFIWNLGLKNYESVGN